MRKANLFYKMTALLPLPFLVFSPVFGGTWAFVALFYLSVFAFLADEALVASSEVMRETGRLDRLMADAVPVILGFAHLFLLPLAILTIANGDLNVGDKIVVFLAFALFFGIVSTANAHELIHRRGWFRHTLGKWILTSLLFGHHVSAHLSVHHRYVATPLDPNSARLNEGFYRFFKRAWLGSFRLGMAVELARLKQNGRTALHPLNPYLIYCGGSAVFLALGFVLAGWLGVMTYLGLALFSQMQLLVSDYVQHYGLERRQLENGKYAPVSIQHSWNAPHVFSSALMLNAPKHSDHHAHPTVPYPELRGLTAEGAPLLPYSLPVMSCIALMPVIWRRVMNPRVADWVRLQQDGLHNI